ncbi:DUF6245 family protein, partial [Nonomuraea turcica]|uniref:DUF6245 family protein n=1 Tax=Nonomuraea sp. G32 TaxID=3067274 RepID=UPI00273B3C6B
CPGPAFSRRLVTMGPGPARCAGPGSSWGAVPSPGDGSRGGGLEELDLDGQHAQRLAMLVETRADGAVDLAEAHDQQLVTADDPVKLTGFLQSQALRVSGSLRRIAQDASTGPIPLAAAHAADGLQRLLGVVAAGQVPSVEQVKVT